MQNRGPSQTGPRDADTKVMTVTNVTLSNMTEMSDLNLAGKRVMIRVDFNVPLKNGAVVSDARIRAVLPTIEAAMKKGAAIILTSHLGRPKEGSHDDSFSLEPVAWHLADLLDHEVSFAKEWLDGVEVGRREIVLCENVRFNAGEKSNADALAKKMAKLCDVFVMDAFGAAHRAHASTHGVAKYAPVACAGPLLVKELETLERALINPKRPLVAIVGGAKVSGKLAVLEALLRKVERLIVGGGIANTIIAAAGYGVGKSLYEPDLIETARRLLDSAVDSKSGIPLPLDVVVAKEASAEAKAQVRDLDSVGENEMILDVGPKTRSHYEDLLQEAGTIVWNGPVGMFELSPFAAGTQALAESVANSDAYSIAGGGDTLAAIERFGVGEGISYISTGGGAFLCVLEGKPLPALEVLQQRAKVA